MVTIKILYFVSNYIQAREASVVDSVVIIIIAQVLVWKITSSLLSFTFNFHGDSFALLSTSFAYYSVLRFVFTLDQVSIHTRKLYLLCWSTNAPLPLLSTYLIIVSMLIHHHLSITMHHSSQHCQLWSESGHCYTIIQQAMVVVVHYISKAEIIYHAFLLKIYFLFILTLPQLW